MASNVKTLKEANGDITYPQTLASAVILSGGTDLETELSKYVTATDISSTSVITPPVDTSMITDGAITAAKLASNAVTNAKIANGAVTQAKMDAGLLSALGSYSTTEAATPFTWIDGKTIYKITISKSVSSFPSSGLSWAHGIANMSAVIKVDTLFNLGWATDNWGDASYLGRAGIGTRVSTANIYVDSTNTLSWTGTMYFTIWYTKSS